MLFGWQLLHKRLELLKSVTPHIREVFPHDRSDNCPHRLGMHTVLHIQVVVPIDDQVLLVHALPVTLI